MVAKRFSGNSNYELNVTPSVSGGTGELLVRVERVTGYGYWKNPPGMAYSTTIDGNTVNGTWLYDFRNGVQWQTVTTRTRSGMTPGTKSWSVTVTMSSGIGSATISGTFTVDPNPPAAPTIGAVTSASDTSQTVNWTRNATTAAPVGLQHLQRRTFGASGWGAWASIASISAVYTTDGTHSRVDKSTVANRAYQYRVKSSNSKGSAYSAASAVVYTTPGTPSALSAVKTSGGGVRLTVAQTVVHSSYETTLQYSVNGGSTWSALTTLASGATSYTWASPPAGETVVFRARVVNDVSSGVGDDRTSGWRTSNSVPLAAPPSPPSQLAPNGVAVDAGENTVVLKWKHNSADTSEQEAYEINYRQVGSSTWTATPKIFSSAQERTTNPATFPNGASYEWRIRTWGAHPDPSNWSATATFTCSTPPEVAVIAPEGTISTSRATAEWTYFDEDGTAQSGWELQLLRDGEVIGARGASGDASSFPLTTRLADLTEYEIRVRVRDGAGLWSPWDSTVFTTDFPLPPAPVVTATWDAEQGTVIAQIDNPEPGPGEVSATSNELLRSLDGEEWVPAVAVAGINTATADQTVPVGVPVMYKAVAWSDLPSSAEGAVVTITTPSDAGYWSAGEGFGSTVTMEYGNGGAPRADATLGLVDKTLHYFAGRELPVEMSGVGRTKTSAVSFLITTPDQLRAVKEMAFMPAPHLIRIPGGELLYCSISEVSLPRVFIDLHEVTFTATEVSV